MKYFKFSAIALIAVITSGSSFRKDLPAAAGQVQYIDVSPSGNGQNPLYSVAGEKWALNSGLGNHRLVAIVDRPGEYMLLSAEIRRRDLKPEQIGVRVFCMENGSEVHDVKILRMSREKCDIVFRAETAGKYAVYLTPFTIGGEVWYFPVVEYMQPESMHPDPAWIEKYSGADGFARLESVESRTEFDSFYPMEIPMMDDETRSFIRRHAEGEMMLVMENRIRPVKMFRDFPQIWFDREHLRQIDDRAARNEYYCFQAALWSEGGTQITEVTAKIDGKKLSDDVFTCFNLGGTDWMGKPFSLDVSLAAGEIRPLWCGIDVEKLEKTGQHVLTVEVKTGTGIVTGTIDLTVTEEILPNKGDNELWRISRLRWLNSTIGLEEYIPQGFEEIGLSGNVISVSGRKLTIGKDGLPSRITASFTEDNSRTDGRENDILHGPVALSVKKDGQELKAKGATLRIKKTGRERVEAQSSFRYGNIRVNVESGVEFDGYADIFITFTPDANTKSIALDNISLTIPMDEGCAKYMMGLGCTGGKRPSFWGYKWDIGRANNTLWIGRENTGLHMKFKHAEEVWEMLNFEKPGMPAWDNNGHGGIRITENAGAVSVDAFTGPIVIREPVTLRIALLVTPMKTIDYDAHWRNRYYHIDSWNGAKPDILKAKSVNATVINHHQGGALLPYINYPFLMTDSLKAEVEMAHENGIKYKLYYTVRELSNMAVELPVLRALGGEVLREGPGFALADHFSETRHELMTGGPWLLEHMPEGFIPAWQQILPDGEYDCALAMTGLSRWHNHYLEGLSWLIREIGVDGLYLDGIGFDRQIMKRVRKVMDMAKPGCLIDFHNGNSYSAEYGYSTPTARFMEVLPYVNSLWFGEGYDYERRPADYYLTEISGIPFGLMGETLNGGGNPYRDMLYGMTCRYGWQSGGNPEHIWKFWDEFGIDRAEMYGYWNPSSPCGTNNSAVPVTVYVNDHAVCLALASWVTGETDDQGIIVNLDCERLGIKQDYIMTSPAIEGFQPYAQYRASEPIMIQPGKGRILVIDR